MFEKIQEQLIAKVIFTVVTIMTLGTSGVAASKIIDGVTLPQKNIQQEVKGENETSLKAQEILSPTPTIVKTLVSSSPTPAVSNPKITPFPTNTPVVNNNRQASTNTNSQCFITLFGKQYDVTALRETHSGGDVFKCGTDMSASYQSRHGTNVTIMQRYLVSSSSNTVSSNSGLGSSAEVRVTPVPTRVLTPTRVLESRRTYYSQDRGEETEDRDEDEEDIRERSYEEDEEEYDD